MSEELVKRLCAARCALVGDPPCYELEWSGPIDKPFRWDGGCCGDGSDLSCKAIAELAPATSHPGEDAVERAARAFADAFTNGNAQFDDCPEHHREAFLEGARSALAALSHDPRRRSQKEALVEALCAVSAIRPSNWDDDEDPEQVAAWKLADLALLKSGGVR